MSIMEKLKAMHSLSELGDEEFPDQVIKVLAGRLAGDVTLMLRITRHKEGGEEVLRPDEMRLEEEGAVKWKLGIVDFDAKYLYQFEDWAAERK